MSAELWPISNSPSSQFPSKIPILSRPLPSNAFNSSLDLPEASCCRAVTAKGFFIIRTGEIFLRVRTVSPSFASTIARLYLSCADDSMVAANRVPIWTPCAPRANAASICLPFAIPPAAITGTETASTTCGTRANVAVSSMPLCPPASKPSATTASTPALTAFWACFTEATT